MVTLTEAARKKIREQLDRRGSGCGIRIGCKTTGCTGLAYTLEYVDEYFFEPNVTNFAQEGFVVIIDNQYKDVLDGLTLDWVRNGLNEGFDITNDKESGRCGCGESFRV